MISARCVFRANQLVETVADVLHHFALLHTQDLAIGERGQVAWSVKEATTWNK